MSGHRRYMVSTLRKGFADAFTAVFVPTAAKPTLSLSYYSSAGEPTNGTIDWGDGTQVAINETRAFISSVHTITDPAYFDTEVRVIFSGESRGIVIYTTATTDFWETFKYVESWGPIQWKQADGLLRRCQGMEKNWTGLSEGAPDLSLCTSMDGAFRDINTDSFNDVFVLPFMDGINLESCTNFANFFNNGNVNPDFTETVTGRITNMGNFGRLNRIADYNLEGFDISDLAGTANVAANSTISVANMDAMYTAWGLLTFSGTPSLLMGTTSKYSAAVQASRDAITSQGVSITDGGAV